MATIKLYPSVISTVLAWTNPNNAKLDDGIYAVTAGTRNSNHDLIASGFTNSIPIGSTINSIVAEVQYKLSTTASAWTGTLQTQVSGVARGTATSITTESITDTVATSNGGVYTYSDLANLQVLFRVRRTSNTACNYSVDYIAVTVGYTAPIYDFSGSASATSGIQLFITGEKFIPIEEHFGSFNSSEGTQQLTLGRKHSSSNTIISLGFEEIFLGFSLVIFQKEGLIELSQGLQENTIGAKSIRGPPNIETIGFQEEVFGYKEISPILIELIGIDEVLTGLAEQPPMITLENLLVDWRGEDFVNQPWTGRLVDRSGNGNDGLQYGYQADQLGITQGNNGNGAIIFRKDTYYDYIITENNLTNIPVVEATFKLDLVPTNWASVVTAYDLNTAYQCGIAFFVHSDGRLGIHYFDGATRHYDLFSDVNFGLNVKHHGLLQYNSITGNLEFYHNGVLAKSLYIPNLVLKPIRFATGSWISASYTGYNFTGLIYEARAYSAPLTPEQVMTNAVVSLGVDKTTLLNSTNGLNQNIIGHKKITTFLSDTLGIIEGLSAQKITSNQVSEMFGVQSAIESESGKVVSALSLNGVEQTLTLQTNKKSSISSTNGVNQIIVGNSEVIISKVGTAILHHGLNQTLFGEKANQISIQTQLGANQSFTHQKEIKMQLTSSVGLNSLVSTSKIAETILLTNLGEKESLISIKKATQSLDLELGFNESLSIKKSNSSSLLDSLGISQTLSGKQPAVINLRESLGLQDEVFGIKRTNASLNLTSAEEINVEAMTSRNSFTQILLGFSESLISLKNSNLNLTTSLGIGSNLQSLKTVIVLTEIQLGLESSIMAFKIAQVDLLQSLGLDLNLSILAGTPYVNTQTLHFAATLPSIVSFEKVISQPERFTSVFSVTQIMGAALSPSVLIYTELDSPEQFTKTLIEKVSLIAVYNQTS